MSDAHEAWLESQVELALEGVGETVGEEQRAWVRQELRRLLAEDAGLAELARRAAPPELDESGFVPIREEPAAPAQSPGSKKAGG